MHRYCILVPPLPEQIPLHLSHQQCHGQDSMFRGFCFVFTVHWQTFFDPIYFHLHAVHLTKKPLLCFYSIDYMPAVDFRHKSHFLSIKSRTEAGGGGTRSMDERLRESRVNDAFGRLLRSIIPNDDWHRCNKSRILRTSFRNRGRPAASLENLWAAWRAIPIPNRPNPHPFPKERQRQINDILTDIFSTSELRRFDLLK